MALIKKDYKDGETVITAENMNAIQDAVIALEDGLFSIDNEARGEIITVTDAAKRSFRGFNIYGKTTQDGTPSPAAPVPLKSAGKSGVINAAVCGKNLVSAIANGTSATGYAGALYCKLNLAPDKEYTVSFVGAVGHKIYANELLFAYKEVLCDGSRQYITLKTQHNISKDRTDQYRDGSWIIFKNLSGNTVVPSFKDVQIECGSAPTAYEPYKGQALAITTQNGLLGIPVAEGGNYTDANGQQWICDEIDLQRGVYVRRIGAMVLDGSVPLSLSSSGAFVLKRADALQIDTNNQLTVVGVMCDAYPAKVWPAISTQGKDGAALMWGQGLAVRDNSFTTVDEFNAHLATNPITMHYILATPAETSLSAKELAAYAALQTYKDNTAVSNDAGAWMEIEYAVDAKKYIDSVIASGAATFANTAIVE